MDLPAADGCRIFQLPEGTAHSPIQSVPMATKIIIEDYQSEWSQQFSELKAVYQKQLGALIEDIQHVGSTSVPGLAAKPVLDIDIIIKEDRKLNTIISRLEALGYTYGGDLGIEGRYAFGQENSTVPKEAAQIWPRHHLYVCLQNSISLKNHLCFRDHLRTNPASVQAYSSLKKELAARYPDDIDAYVAHKTPFIISVLKNCNFDSAVLSKISTANKAAY